MIALALVAALVVGQANIDPGAGFAPPRQGQEPLDPEHEARVMRIGKLIRCTVCQGVSIADSPASTARAMLDKVREMVSAGQTDEQIFQYFEDRYGEFALERPKTEGSTLGLWMLPVLLLGGGLLLVWMQVKKKPAGATAADAVKPVEDEFLAKVRSDLGKPS